MEKIRYEVDPYNRLVINKMPKYGLPPEYRLSLDGYFKTTKDNSLTYHIKTPYKYPLQSKLPHRINFKGRYSLTHGHDIRYTLSHSYNQRSREKLLIKGDIISVNEDSLAFSVTSISRRSGSTTRTFTLNGKWQLDKRNRITFLAQRENGKHDTLTFKGSWGINKNNEIEYVYKKKRLKCSRKLVFKGVWEAVNKHKLRYLLGVSGNSAFELKAALEKTGFLGRKNTLEYKIETKIKGQRTNAGTVKLLGSWRLTKNMGLLFEIAYSGKKKSSISFGAEARLSKTGKLLFLLKDRKGGYLGIEVRLKKSFLDNSGEILLKLSAYGNEKSVILSAGRLF